MVFESSMEADPSGLGFSLQKLSKISGRWNRSIDGAAGGAGGAGGADGADGAEGWLRAGTSGFKQSEGPDGSKGLKMGER